MFSRRLASTFPSPFTSPVFTSTAIIICILLLFHISYEDYGPAKEIMTYLLGPATVALAIPLNKHREMLFKNMIPAFTGLAVGSLSTILTAVFMAKWFDLSKTTIASLSIKSITIPVASEVAKIIGANSVLVAGFVMITGMLGAMFGPAILNRLHIDHPFARGLSIGTISHGIGTAEAVREGELQGAIAGVAIALAAVFTSFIIPIVLPFLLKM